LYILVFHILVWHVMIIIKKKTKFFLSCLLHKSSKYLDSICAKSYKKKKSNLRCWKLPCPKIDSVQHFII
jgi:hypothetical protein